MFFSLLGINLTSQYQQTAPVKAIKYNRPDLLHSDIVLFGASMEPSTPSLGSRIAFGVKRPSSPYEDENGNPGFTISRGKRKNTFMPTSRPVSPHSSDDTDTEEQKKGAYRRAFNRIGNMPPDRQGKNRARHKAENMTKDRLEKHRAGSRAENMTKDRLEKHRAWGRAENLTAEQLEKKRALNRIGNMPPERLEKKKAGRKNPTEERLEKIRELDRSYRQESKNVDDLLSIFPQTNPPALLDSSTAASELKPLLDSVGKPIPPHVIRKGIEKHRKKENTQFQASSTQEISMGINNFHIETPQTYQTSSLKPFGKPKR